ncbi:hypothetical protein MKW92_008225 [Papaver armeniacum]|nr:hypothetical protein MKW92_008225 [Papaver armeniacum]
MAELDAYSLRACLVYINSMKRSGATRLKMEDYSVAMVKLAQSLEMRKTFMMLESLDEKAQFISNSNNSLPLSCYRENETIPADAIEHVVASDTLKAQ